MLSIGLALDRTDAPDVRAAMVTVDPARDQPDVLTDYVHQFVPGGHALRPANQAELDELVIAIGAQYEITKHAGHDVNDSSPDVGHTSFAYVIDDTGTVSLVWTADITADEMAQDLEVLSDRLYGS